MAKKYFIDFTDDAKVGIKRFEKSGEKSVLKKLNALLAELKDHPRTGTGKPEQLKGYGEQEVWSRRITDKHRLVYEIKENVVIVLILSAFGHYEDK